MFKDKLMSLLKINNKKEGDYKNQNIQNKSLELNNKKKIENAVFLLILIIITVVIINYVWNGNKTSDKNSTNSTIGKQLADNKTTKKTTDTSNKNNKIENDLETRLENILSTIDGIKDVKVFINYSESNETVAMYNENSKTSVTEEKDKTGGVRKIEQTDSQKEIVYQEERRK